MDTDEQKTATEPDTAGTDDPGWALHDTVADGDRAERWLYHYADLTVVDEDGTPFEPDADGVLTRVDDLEDQEEAPYAEEPAHEPEPVYEPDLTYEPLAYDAPDRRLDLSRLPARTVVLAALVVSALLTIGLLAVVATRWGGLDSPADTATSTSRLTLPGAVPPDSEYVRSRVLPNGDIWVDHWISSTRPMPRIVLALPTPAGTERAGADPVTAREVRVETPAGDREGPAVLDGSPQSYALDDAEEVHVSYVLSGAVSRSGEGSARALARATSLVLDVSGSRLPRTLVLQGGRLLSAACTTDAAAQPRPCGQAEGRSWRVRLEPPERGDLVLAQLDLSPA